MTEAWRSASTVAMVSSMARGNLRAALLALDSGQGAADGLAGLGLAEAMALAPGAELRGSNKHDPSPAKGDRG